MNRKKPISILALALVMASCFALGASASGALQEIKAYLDPTITIKLEGEAQTFLDAKGNRVYPITYEGSTYLPVRAVAGLAGFEVNWDQATRTVELGETKGVDLIDTYEAYDMSTSDNRQIQSDDKMEMEISGVSCSHWLKVHQSWGDSGKGHIEYASFNLLGKYETLTFQYYAEKDVILRVLGDNDSVLFEREVPGGQVAQTATVPLLKTNQLTFQTEKLLGNGSDTYGDTYIFNAHLE